MKGRPLRGDGLDHEQDYVRERIEETAGPADYEKAAEELEQQMRDLEALPEERPMPDLSIEAADVDDLRRTATLPTEGIEVRQGEMLDTTTNSVVNPRQQPPEAEARARLKSSVEGGSGGTARGR